MSSVHETAYPRFKPELTQRELDDIYTPSKDELAFAQCNGRTIAARLSLLILLKTIQRLGYFVKLSEVPPLITSHIAKSLGLRIISKQNLQDYEQAGPRQRLLELIRKYLDIKSIVAETALVLSIALQAAETKQELPDIVNVIIEELVR